MNYMYLTRNGDAFALVLEKELLYSAVGCRLNMMIFRVTMFIYQLQCPHSENLLTEENTK